MAFEDIALRSIGSPLGHDAWSVSPGLNKASLFAAVESRGPWFGVIPAGM